MNKNQNGKVIATITIAFMVTAMFLSITNVAANHTAEVDVEPTSVKGDSRELFEVSVTNAFGSEDNIYQVWLDKGCLGCSIAGIAAGENFVDAADNLDMASAYLDNAEGYLADSASLKLTSGGLIEDMSNGVEEASDLLGLYPDNYEDAEDSLDIAQKSLSRAGDELATEPENMVYASYHTGRAGDHIWNGAENIGNDDGTGWDDDAENALKKSGRNLQMTAEWLENGDFQMASDNLVSAGQWMIYAGENLKMSSNPDVSDAGTALISSGETAMSAGENLWRAAENIKMAGEMMFADENDSAVSGIIEAAQLLEDINCLKGVSDNLGGSAELLAFASLNTGRWQDLDPELENFNQDIFAVGDNLVSAAGYFDDAGMILGKALGGQHFQHIGSDPGFLLNAGENLRNPEMLDLNTAAGQIGDTSTHLGLAAGVLSSTGTTLVEESPEGWTFDSEGIHGHPTWTASPMKGENNLAPGESATFPMLMNTPDGEDCCDISVYTVDTAMFSDCGREGATDNHDFQVCYDSACASLESGRVYQPNVGENNLVGDEYDDGMATVEFTFDEEVDSVGPVTVVADGENVENVSVSTTDDMTFTGEFEVEEWDDNQMEIYVWDSTDMFGNSGCGPYSWDFSVDTRDPFFDNTCPVSEGNSGLMEAVDTYAEWITGRAQAPENVWATCIDTWTVNGQVIDNCEGINPTGVKSVKAYVNGSLAETATIIAGENMFSADDLELGSDGVKSITIEVTDMTGNSAQDTVENIFLDTTDPQFSGMTPENGAILNDATQTVSIDVADFGLGVGWAELVDTTDNSWTVMDTGDNFLSDLTLENTRTWSEGVHTVYASATDNMLRYCTWCVTEENLTGYEEENYTENVLTCVWSEEKQRYIEDTIEVTRTRMVPQYETVALRENDIICDHRISTSWTFRIDTTPPDRPNFEGEGCFGPACESVEVRQGSVTVTGTAEKSYWEEYSDLSVEVYVNDELQTTVTPDSRGMWSADVDLAPGQNKVEALVIDAAGNESELELGGYADFVITPEVEDPIDGSSASPGLMTKSGEIELTGSGVPGSTMNVYVNGSSSTTADVNADGQWDATVSLDSGMNRIQVSSTVEGVESKMVSYGYVLSDTTNPSVSVDAPSDGMTTGEPTVTVEATVSDDVTPNEEVMVSVRSPAYTVPEQEVTVGSDGSLTIDVPLAEGNNTITVVARDGVGNVGTANVTVTKTVEEATEWAMYATFAAIIAVILAAIAIIRRSQ